MAVAHHSYASRVLSETDFAINGNGSQMWGKSKCLRSIPGTRTRFPPKRVVRMGLREDGPSVAVVGITGAVGQEFLSVLSDRDFPYRSLRLLASKRSAGKQMTFEGRDYVVEELTEDSFHGIDIALFSAGGSISKKFGPIAAQQGTVVVDNSSAFRMDDGVPLVIPEVNPEAMSHIKLSSKKGAIIANPNCSTIICLMAATPLHRHAKVRPTRKGRRDLFWRTSDEVSRLKIQLIFNAREGVGYYSKEQEAPPDAESSHVWRSVQLKLSIWQHV